MNSRRDFLKGTAWMGLAATAAGCMGGKGGICGIGCGEGAPMHGYRCAPIKHVRVGVVGLGGRGRGAVKRLSRIPGCTVAAICDINPSCLAQCRDWLKENKKPAAKEFGKTNDDWKAMCDWDGIDVVYSVLPRHLHNAVNVYSMAAGKHIMQEVPGCFTIDECWSAVEAAEKYRRHCYMLENCCYGEYEMLAFNLINKGMLGEIVQADVCYTHDQRVMQYEPKDGNFWRIKRHQTHHGNYYPTHGLVPAGKCFNVNRGDRFDYLVSMETKSASFEAYAKSKFPEGDWRHAAEMTKGDINTCLIRTVNGKVMKLSHNVCTPTPYDRGNWYYGTRGTIRGIKDWNYNVAFEAKLGDGGCEKYFDAKKAEEIRETYKHPFWKVAGEVAKKVGGHGGMDFIMDLRWVYCLQNGLPMDTDVYDMATYSSIVELSERSVNEGSKPVYFPDYTRGAWKCQAPFTIDEMDMSKFDFSDGVKAAGGQLEV